MPSRPLIEWTAVICVNLKFSFSTWLAGWYDFYLMRKVPNMLFLDPSFMLRINPIMSAEPRHMHIWLSASYEIKFCLFHGWSPVDSWAEWSVSHLKVSDSVNPLDQGDFTIMSWKNLGWGVGDVNLLSSEGRGDRTDLPWGLGSLFC